MAKKYKAIKGDKAWRAGEEFVLDEELQLLQHSTNPGVFVDHGSFPGMFEEVKEPEVKYLPETVPLFLKVDARWTVSPGSPHFNGVMAFDTLELTYNAERIFREVAKHLPHSDTDKPRKIRLVVECDKEEATPIMRGYPTYLVAHKAEGIHDFRVLPNGIMTDPLATYPVKVIDLTKE